MIKVIESENNKLVKYFIKLKMTKYMVQEKKFLIEGEHLLEMAPKDDIEAILTLEELKEYPSDIQYKVNENILKKVSNNQSFSKVIAIIKRHENNQIEGDLCLLLDSLQDPGNVGTILRTCLAFNVKTVISTSSNIFYNLKTIQSSQGAIFSLNLLQLNDNLLSDLKENYQFVATTLSDKSLSLEEFKMTKPTLLIVGNEGQGVSQFFLDLSPIHLKIEMNKELDSLNVGVATGIILYKLRH